MLRNSEGTPSGTLPDIVLCQRDHKRWVGGPIRDVLCSEQLSDLWERVTWPSGRLMNQSIVVPTRVLMNSLHLTASEPPTSILCVWKALRWASGSSILVKVTLDPTNVAGITASMISYEYGIENSLGSVVGS